MFDMPPENRSVQNERKLLESHFRKDSNNEEDEVYRATDCLCSAAVGAGFAVEEITRKMGVSEATFYRWKKKFGGMGIAELRRLRQLEDENRKLKNLVADLSLDKAMLQDVLSKKV